MNMEINAEALWNSLYHRVKIITTSGEERIGKVFLFESLYDSDCDENCIWLDDYGYILRQSDISTLEILD